MNMTIKKVFRSYTAAACVLVLVGIGRVEAIRMERGRRSDQSVAYGNAMMESLTTHTQTVNKAVCDAYQGEGEKRVGDFQKAVDVALGAAKTALETRKLALAELMEKIATGLGAATTKYSAIASEASAVRTNPGGQVQAIVAALNLNPTLLLQDWKNLQGLVGLLAEFTGSSKIDASGTTAAVAGSGHLKVLEDQLGLSARSKTQIGNLFNNPTGTNFQCGTEEATAEQKTTIEEKYMKIGADLVAAASAGTEGPAPNSGHANPLFRAYPRASGVLKFKAGELQLQDNIALDSYLMEKILLEFETQVETEANTILMSAWSVQLTPAVNGAENGGEALKSAINAVFTYLQQEGDKEKRAAATASVDQDTEKKVETEMDRRLDVLMKARDAIISAIELKPAEGTQSLSSTQVMGSGTTISGLVLAQSPSGFADVFKSDEPAAAKVV